MKAVLFGSAVTRYSRLYRVEKDFHKTVQPDREKVEHVTFLAVDPYKCPFKVVMYPLVLYICLHPRYEEMLD